MTLFYLIFQLSQLHKFSKFCAKNADFVHMRNTHLPHTKISPCVHVWDIYVTYRVFMVVFLHARACRRVHVRLLTCDVGRHVQLLTSSRHNVVIWCRKEH